MNFTFSSALYLLPLAAVPIIIHLLQRQRYVRVPFAATDFLKRAVQRVRRRVLLQDLLLLILRTLAVLLIIFALARPSSNPNLLTTTRPPKLDVVIIDSSMSMQQFVGNEDAFSNALSLANGLFGQLNAGHDQAALIIAGGSSKLIAGGPPIEAMSALSSGLRCGNSNADWQDAAQLTRDAISRMASTNSEVTVHVISDFQNSDWTIGGTGHSALETLADLNFQIDYVAASYGETANMSLSNAEISPPTVVKGGLLSFACEVTNHTDRPLERNLQLKVDDKIIAEKKVAVSARGTTIFQHSFHPSEIGTRSMTAKMNADGLNEDDQLSLGFKVTNEMATIMCSNNSKFDLADVSSNLMAYLNLGDDAPLRPLALTPHQITAEELSQAQLLILSDLNMLPVSKHEIISGFVAAGGGLLIAIGPNSSTSAHQGLMLSLGLEEFSIGPELAASSLLQITNDSHPAVNLFNDAQWQPLLTEVPHREFRPIVAKGQQLDTILEFVTNDKQLRHPALIEFKHQRGRIAVLAAAPYAGYNRMPEVPGGTMALIYDLLFSLTPPALIPPFLEIGQRLNLEEELAINSPSNVNLPFSVNLSLNELGAYQVGDYTLGVHPLKAESDLRSVDLSTLPSYKSAAGELITNNDQSKSESKLAELLLMVFLLCLVFESLLALFIDRRRTA
ncbi:MAG: BatA domain-containing protein [Planctomycetota bacterium]|jgi:phenylpyruvate tautomerase PptA (4-oxalocrotonate tautomerase family)|nr:BatA domain-containing protein [Planctomycetota bacterium]